MKKLLLILLFFTFTAQKCDDNQKPPSELFKHWVHSFEDNKEGLKAYRPADYNFPRSRGRKGMEFKEDGTYIQYDIAPNDKGKVTREGRWEIVSENKLSIQLPDQEPFIITFESLSDEILYIKN